jgi:hypothetical protein
MYLINETGCNMKSFLPKTLKMGQTSDPKTLVIKQKLTPVNDPKKILSNITTMAEAFNYMKLQVPVSCQRRELYYKCITPSNY